MKNTRKLLGVMFTVAVVATSYFGFVSASQAGWFYGPSGWTYCNVANNVEWCN